MQKVTVTAAGTEHTTCSCCGRKVEQRYLLGLSAQGITVATVAEVARWKCADCFGALCSSSRSCAVREVARCYRCGGREKLCALDAQHITTADVAKVAMWCCEGCFDDPSKATKRVVARGKAGGRTPKGGCRR